MVKSGNYLIDGSINSENLTKTLKKISKRAFAHKTQESQDIKPLNGTEMIEDF